MTRNFNTLLLAVFVATNIVAIHWIPLQGTVLPISIEQPAYANPKPTILPDAEPTPKEIEVVAQRWNSYIATNKVEQDPLINQGGKVTIKIGIFLIAILSVILVKVFSPRVEHAILFALFLSIILIGFIVL